MTATLAQNARTPMFKVILGTICAMLLTACVETADVADGAATTAVETAAPATPSLLSSSNNRKLLEALDICLADFPDTLAIRTKLRQSGYKSELRFRDREFFSAYNGNIIIAITTGGAERACVLGVDGLRNEDAVLFAGSLFAARSNGTLLVGSPTDPRFIGGFKFDAPNGTTLAAAVGRQTSIGNFFNGSPIFITEFKE